MQTSGSKKMFHPRLCPTENSKLGFLMWRVLITELPKEKRNIQDLQRKKKNLLLPYGQYHFVSLKLQHHCCASCFHGFSKVSLSCFISVISSASNLQVYPLLFEGLIHQGIYLQTWKEGKHLELWSSLDHGYRNQYRQLFNFQYLGKKKELSTISCKLNYD